MSRINKSHLVWFRKDLRISDNPALLAAASEPIIPIYINDPAEQMGAMSKLWLNKSLEKLSKSLGQLHIYNGRPIDIIKRLVAANNVSGVFWNKCYEPWRSDKEVVKYLDQIGIEHHTFNGSLLWEPDSVLKSDGTYYRVFTPFYKKGCLATEPRMPDNSKLNIRFASNALQGEGLEFKQSTWHHKLDINPGEEAAHDRLAEFLEGGANGYKEGRNFPATNHTSQLSPHLHFGEISPNQVWYKAKQADLPTKDLEHFLSELGWREFSYYLLHHFPGLPSQNFQPKFDKFPWSHDAQKLEAWQKGMTGYPIVDAAMRQLWQTGYMHNRTRMIAASFLVKNLFVHWHHGRDWFWDCLSDADLANNSAGWQWVAGSGADAAPYFRIFNPILQSEKFDPDGDYIRKYVPELSKLPTKFLHAPWTAPQGELESAKVRLGSDYPYPIIDFAETRNQSLEYYKRLS